MEMAGDCQSQSDLDVAFNASFFYTVNMTERVSYCAPHKKKKIIQVWNNIWFSKWRQNLHFLQTGPLSSVYSVKYGQCIQLHQISF